MPPLLPSEKPRTSTPSEGVARNREREGARGSGEGRRDDSGGAGRRGDGVGGGGGGSGILAAGNGGARESEPAVAGAAIVVACLVSFSARGDSSIAKAACFLSVETR